MVVFRGHLTMQQACSSTTGGKSGDGAAQTLLRLNDKLLLLVLKWLSLQEQHELLLVCRGLYRQLCCLPFIRSIRCLSSHTGFELLVRQHRHHPLLQQQQQLLQQQQKQQQQLKHHLQQQRGRELQRKRGLEQQQPQRQEADIKKTKGSPCAAVAAAAAREPPSAVMQQRPTFAAAENSKNCITTAAARLAGASAQEPREAQLPLQQQQQQQKQQQQHQQVEVEELQRYILACPLLSRLRGCKVVQLAVPAHLPPSPVLLMLLLCCAKSLRKLQVIGYDYGSFRYHRRRQQQQQRLLLQQQQQQQQECQGETAAASADDIVEPSSSSTDSSSTDNSSSMNSSSSNNESSSSSDEGAWCSAASCLPGDWFQPGRLWFTAAAADALLLRFSSKLRHLLLDVSLRRGFGVSPFAQLNLACKLQGLKELELVNLTRENFRCGPCYFPALEIMRLHWVDVCPERHKLGLLLQGCPSLRSLCVHTECDDDEVLIQTAGLFAAALQQLLQQVLQQQPQHNEQQQQQQQQQTGRPPRMGVVEDAAAATARAALERGVCPLPLLQHLQLPLLAASAVPLLRAAAPEVEVLRLLHAESHRSGRGLLVLQQAAQQLQKLEQIIFPTRVDFVPNGFLPRKGLAAGAAGVIVRQASPSEFFVRCR